MKSLRVCLIAAALAALIGSAQAHTPFMKPESFQPRDGQITAEAGYSTQILVPAVGLPAAPMALYAPDGERTGYIRIDVQSGVTRLQALLAREGTYRLSTGEHYGEVTQMVLDRGRWRPLAAGERARRRRTSTLQMVTLADAYVTRGAATRPAVDMTIGRLAIRPVTHPNQINVAGGFEVELLFDSAPFAFMPFVVYRPGESEDDMHRVFVTDEHGRAHLSFDSPGLYLAAVRYRAPAPRTARAAVRSYSTSITFEVAAG